MKKIMKWIVRSTVVALVSTASLFAQTPGGGDDIITLEIEGIQGIEGGRRMIIQDRSLINDTIGNVQAFTANPNRKWIGIVCGPVEDVLRAHIDLPEGVGIVVQQVIPDSPAAAAGLQQYDVLTDVGGKKAHSVADLVGAIGALEDDGKLMIQWQRKGQPMSAEVTPVDRPHSVKLEFQPDGDVKNDVTRIKKWLGKLEGGQWQGVPSKLRIFGPGIPVAGEMPTNLNINIQKNGNQPAKITVKRNDDSWQVTEDSLDELPDDIRPHVESMLGGTGLVFGWETEGRLDKLGPGTDAVWPRMEERLDEMKRHMEELHKEFQRLHEQGTPPSPEDGGQDDPKNDASIVPFRFDKVASFGNVDLWS